ncbi:MAG TPA: hypothetical protein VF048_12015 [Gemmatimonadaceae bacterium]
MPAFTTTRRPCAAFHLPNTALRRPQRERRRRLGIALVVLAVAGGCTASGEEAMAGRLTQVDYDAMPVLTLEPEEMICAARADSSCAFVDVNVAAVGPDGRVALSDGMREIREFGADGQFVRQIGRLGRGPGEYRTVMAAGYDSAGVLTVFDVWGHRIVRFDSTGAAMDAAPAPQVIATQNAKVVGGRVLLFVLPGAEAIGDTVQARIVTVGMPGADTATLARFALPAIATGDGSLLPPQPPFTAAPYQRWTVAPDGAAYLADGARLRIDRVDGERRTIVDGVVTPHPVSDAERDAARERLTRVSPGMSTASVESWRRQAEAALAAAPSAHPLVAELVALDDGTLWAREGAPADADSVRWNAFAPDGRPIGRLTLPARGRLVAGTRERLLLVTHDAFDVPIVGWYAVRGAAARR